MSDVVRQDRRGRPDRRRVPRGGRRPYDRAGCHPPILVADGYDGARLPAARYLSRHHFAVAEAATGEEALQRILANPPQVILADLSLPSMPARRLCHWLEQSWRTRNIPVIVMVGDYEGEPIPPVAGILVKPFSLATMLEEIRRVLRASMS
jgi:phosphoserine phosphatase RsbU/P